MKPNIYSYPENPNDLPAYRIAVMQAALEGKPVQFLDRCLCGAQWHDMFSQPDWNWIDNAYRIRPEPAYKPWSAETFRWPDCLRRRDVGNGPGNPFGILEVRPEGVTSRLLSCGSHYEQLIWGQLLAWYEASYDRGQTWQRCGEEVK